MKIEIHSYLPLSSPRKKTRDASTRRSGDAAIPAGGNGSENLKSNQAKMQARLAARRNVTNGSENLKSNQAKMAEQARLAAEKAKFAVRRNGTKDDEPVKRAPPYHVWAMQNGAIASPKTDKDIKNNVEVLKRYNALYPKGAERDLRRAAQS
jgi:hypothetical protein